MKVRGDVMERMRQILDDLDGETRRNLAITGAVLLMGGIAGAVLAWHQPTRWVGALAFGCGVSSALFFGLGVVGRRK